jgi:3-hydroxybutyryl-CoA dehydrogenase
MSIERVAVIGAGTMGTGVATVFLVAGHELTLVDRSEDQLAEAEEAIREGDHVAPDAVADHLSLSTEMGAVEGVDLIIEAVPEDLEVKRSVFSEVADHNGSALYATNTSSIPLARMQDAVPDPSRFVGLHFFNPAPVMDIIELVVTDKTSDAVEEEAVRLIETLGKEHSRVKDVPGFVSNRILMPFLNEAMKTLERGIADPEAIDRIAENGFNHPMGPLTLADFIGLDVCLDIMERLYEEEGDERFRPASVLREKVEEGKLGKKSGAGFYSYD